MSGDGGAVWRRYPYETGDLRFPDVEGTDSTSEYGWWYLNFHLEDPAGGKTVAFVSFVHPSELLGSVTDVARGFHRGEYRTGELRSRPDRLDVEFHHAQAPVSYLRQVPGEAFHYELFASLCGYELDFRLRSLKPPFALAGTGYVRQLPATYSYYYAQPRMAVEGTMRRADGSSSAAAGIAWLDRQWYPPDNPGTDVYMGHFWAAIHLDDGCDIAAYRALGEGGSVPFPLFDVMGADNTYEHYAVDTVTSADLVSVPAPPPLTIPELRFPRTAQVTHPETGTDLRLTVLVPDPAANVLVIPEKGCLYEGGYGVSGTHGGRPVAGEAFVEVSLFGAQL